jgi:hypothetical protein
VAAAITKTVKFGDANYISSLISTTTLPERNPNFVGSPSPPNNQRSLSITLSPTTAKPHTQLGLSKPRIINAASLNLKPPDNIINTVEPLPLKSLVYDKSRLSVTDRILDSEDEQINWHVSSMRLESRNSFASKPRVQSQKYSNYDISRSIASSNNDNSETYDISEEKVTVL